MTGSPLIVSWPSSSPSSNVSAVWFGSSCQQIVSPGLPCCWLLAGLSQWEALVGDQRAGRKSPSCMIPSNPRATAPARWPSIHDSSSHGAPVTPFSSLLHIPSNSGGDNFLLLLTSGFSASLVIAHILACSSANNPFILYYSIKPVWVEPCFLLGSLQVHEATALRHHRVDSGQSAWACWRLAKDTGRIGRALRLLHFE